MGLYAGRTCLPSAGTNSIGDYEKAQLASKKGRSKINVEDFKGLKHQIQIQQTPKKSTLSTFSADQWDAKRMNTFKKAFQEEVAANAKHRAAALATAQQNAQRYGQPRRSAMGKNFNMGSGSSTRWGPMMPILRHQLAPSSIYTDLRRYTLNFQMIDDRVLSE